MYYCRYFIVLNLERASPEEKVKLCKKYFYIGFFALPVVWLVNAVWFFREAFFKNNNPLMLKRYVIFSAIGFLVWAVFFAISPSTYLLVNPDYINITMWCKWYIYVYILYVMMTITCVYLYLCMFRSCMYMPD